jgi:hypothetical protein
MLLEEPDTFHTGSNVAAKIPFTRPTNDAETRTYMFEGFEK